MTIESKWLGKFVTAKLQGVDDCRQGRVIDEGLFVIKGESGTYYICEGEPILVCDPPNKTPATLTATGVLSSINS